jgi:hypothetical protein
MKLTLNKNTIVSLLLLLVIAVIVYRITPVFVDKNVKVVISKNRIGISDIHQVRDITSTTEVMVDTLNLQHKGKFGHAKLGNIAKASDDFFVDVDQMVTTFKDGTYEFLIGSDDGFSLAIDGKIICEHPKDRPYSIQPCNVFLTKGDHRVMLSYFQGFGNSGFTVQYKTGDGKVYWFGENSPGLRLK